MNEYNTAPGSGGAYAKLIPDTLAFGSVFPGDEVRGHIAKSIAGRDAGNLYDLPRETQRSHCK